MKRVPDIRPVPMSDGLKEIICPCGELVYSASSFGRCPSCRRRFGFSPPPGRDYQEKFFIAPFVDDFEYYYKRVSYDEVFRKARNDIDNNRYQWTGSADDLKYELTLSAHGLIEARDALPPDTDLTWLIKSIGPICPDLFESNNPSARKLAAHFGRLRWDSHNAATPQERKKAREAIDAIMGSKTPDTKGKKIVIPPLLSLNDMYEYLHRITKYLQEQYINEYGCDPLPEDVFTDETKLGELCRKELREIDPRFEEMVEKNLIEMLVHRPGELTTELMAQFLGYTPGTLTQYLKQEKQSSPPPKGVKRI